MSALPTDIPARVASLVTSAPADRAWIVVSLTSADPSARAQVERHVGLDMPELYASLAASMEEQGQRLADVFLEAHSPDVEPSAVGF